VFATYKGTADYYSATIIGTSYYAAGGIFDDDAIFAVEYYDKVLKEEDLSITSAFVRLEKS
jgi:hypothetical protein